MEEKNFEGISHECIRSGQISAYCDHEAVYKVTVEEGKDYSEEDILDYCFTVISKHKVQSRSEWAKACGDMGKYFAGYYTLNATPGGYMYTKISPYTD
jgi:hypothetical protein